TDRAQEWSSEALPEDHIPAGRVGANQMGMNISDVVSVSHCDMKNDCPSSALVKDEKWRTGRDLGNTTVEPSNNQRPPPPDTIIGKFEFDGVMDADADCKNPKEVTSPRSIGARQQGRSIDFDPPEFARCFRDALNDCLAIRAETRFDLEKIFQEDAEDDSELHMKAESPTRTAGLNARQDQIEEERDIDAQTGPRG
ncbi:unnamed protein product, partial [Amoebophrya sp. A25]